jgi:hypothetical protein
MNIPVWDSNKSKMIKILREELAIAEARRASLQYAFTWKRYCEAMDNHINYALHNI